jgi:Leucine-rich repeat (LRR) protein
VDISVLSDSTTLVELNISNNEVSDITKLSGLVRLTRFDFSHNR